MRLCFDANIMAIVSLAHVRRMFLIICRVQMRAIASGHYDYAKCAAHSSKIISV